MAKWKKLATVEDLKTGPKAPHATTLTDAKDVTDKKGLLLPAL